MTMTETIPVALRNVQAETFEALEFELNRLDRTPPHRRNYRLQRIDVLGVDLWRMCQQLQDALTEEDNRLRALHGSSAELDDRWIKNLHRLERMLALLARAKSVIPGTRIPEGS